MESQSSNIECTDIELQAAINDFILGEGKGSPSQEVCEILIKKHPIINNFVRDALKKENLKKISIMPYGDSLQCWENPVFEGSCSITMPILDPNDTTKTILEVVFDRN